MTEMPTSAHGDLSQEVASASGHSAVAPTAGAPHPHLGDPRLGRFNPLARILSFDDFDHGTCGWTAHIGNYEGNLDTLLTPYADLRPAQLSNLTMWDVGTMGAMDGTYALKAATRPTAGHIAMLIKRQTWRALTDVRFEAYLSYKPEASASELGELDVRAFGIGFDLQDHEVRWMPQYRFLVSLNQEPPVGEQTNQDTLAAPKGIWQHRTTTSPITRIGGTGRTISHWHLPDDGWEAIPGAHQAMCYNEIATKVNWFYVCVDLNMANRSVTRIQCNDQVIDNHPLQFISLPAMPNLHGMLNVFFWVQTDTAKRAFLYVDSAVLSASATH